MNRFIFINKIFYYTIICIIITFFNGCALKGHNYCRETSLKIQLKLKDNIDKVDLTFIVDSLIFIEDERYVRVRKKSITITNREEIYKLVSLFGPKVKGISMGRQNGVIKYYSNNDVKFDVRFYHRGTKSYRIAYRFAGEFCGCSVTKEGEKILEKYRSKVLNDGSIKWEAYDKY